jgi:hypothetical protein
MKKLVVILLMPSEYRPNEIVETPILDSCRTPDYAFRAINALSSVSILSSTSS